jgi:hypothetical protein
VWKATWAVAGRVKDAKPVQVDFQFREGPILQKDWMGGMLRCEPQVAQ